MLSYAIIKENDTVRKTGKFQNAKMANSWGFAETGELELPGYSYEVYSFKDGEWKNHDGYEVEFTEPKVSDLDFDIDECGRKDFTPFSIYLFEEDYKKCFQELIELEADGITDKVIRFYISDDGEHYCKSWGYNCSYSVSDLEANKEYEADEAYFEIHADLLSQWQDDVRANIIYCRECDKYLGFDADENICKICKQETTKE